jgi:hypothetical protein
MAFTLPGIQGYWRVIVMLIEFLMLMSCTPRADTRSCLEVVLFPGSLASRLS